MGPRLFKVLPKCSAVWDAVSQMPSGKGGFASPKIKQKIVIGLYAYMVDPSNW